MTASLHEGDVHVWRVRLDRVPPVSREVLSDEELECADRFLSPSHVARYMGCRSALRRILGAYVGVEPRSIAFAVTANGRPVLPGEPGRITFSVTNTEDLALVALSRTRTIGIDVEKVRALDDLALVAKYFYTGEECRCLMELPVASRTHAFYRLWTQKEALFKARGVSTHKPLRRAAARATAAVRGLERSAEAFRAGHWLLVSFQAAPDYAATLAMPGTLRELVVRDFIQ